LLASYYRINGLTIQVTVRVTTNTIGFKMVTITKIKQWLVVGRTALVVVVVVVVAQVEV